MEITLPAFTLVEESLFLTLCGRALDSRSPRSFLSDRMAEEIAGKIGYDLAKFPMAASKNWLSTATRDFTSGR